MRAPADRHRILRFLRELGRRTRSEATVYLSGGPTAVLHGWRPSTIDIDLRLDPEADDMLRAIAVLKDDLQTKLASRLDFIPAPPGWEERSTFVAQEGSLTIMHLDPYAQAMAKIERDHAMDRADVQPMLRSGLVQAMELRTKFQAIEPDLYRFPAVEPHGFRRRVEQLVVETGS